MDAGRTGMQGNWGMGAGDMALLGFFSSPWNLVLKGPPWLVLLYCLAQQVLKGQA